MNDGSEILLSSYMKFNQLLFERLAFMLTDRISI